jgi:hypothetical protein
MRRYSVLHDGPGCSWVCSLKIFVFDLRQFSSDYHKLFTYPCAVRNDVRLISPSVRRDLSQVRRVLYVVMPVTWHLGQCGNVLRCSLYATMRVNTIVSPSSSPPRTRYRSLHQLFVARLWTLSPYHVFLFSALLNEGDSTWVGVSP